MKNLYARHLYWILPVLFIVLLLIDGYRTQQKNKSLHLIAWENHLLITTKNTHILWGKEDEKSILMSSGFRSFRSTPVPFQEPQKLQEGIFKTSLNNTTILFLTSIDIDPSLPYSLQSDWWVLSKTILPENVPLPSKGILFLGKQSPGKSLTEKAKQNNIPLISINKTGTFWLQKKDNTWSLKTEK